MPGSIPNSDKQTSLFSRNSRLALGPTQFFIQLEPVVKYASNYCRTEGATVGSVLLCSVTVATQVASVSFDMFIHRAKAVATQVASVSLVMFIHRAKAAATQVASVSLVMFIHRAKAVATQAASVSLVMFIHRAKAVATQVASVSLDMLTHPGLRLQ
jgi:hypothetical protein